MSIASDYAERVRALKAMSAPSIKIGDRQFSVSEDGNLITPGGWEIEAKNVPIVIRFLHHTFSDGVVE